MRMRAASMALVALFGLSPGLTAQGFGIGARAGSLGFGAEAALGISDELVVRGGLGSFFMDFDGEYDGVEYTVTPPSLTGTVGIDFYPTGGAFRLMGGFMFRDGDIDLETGDIAQAGGIEIGEGFYEESGRLLGSFASRSTAPFIGLGFGHHTSGGFGFFLDLGVAFTGEPDVTLEADGAIASVPGIQADLDREVQDLKDEAGTYLEYWPIISLGVKIPFS